jgi:hypothetical protein
VLVALGLNQHIENLALGVDCTPQICRPPIDLQKDVVMNVLTGTQSLVRNGAVIGGLWASLR